MKVRIETNDTMHPFGTTIIIDGKDISDMVENYKIVTDRKGLTKLILSLIPSKWEIKIKETK